MKVIRETDECIILFLYKSHQLDFENPKRLQEQLKKLFLKLKYYYDIKIEGFYEVNAYVDNLYGVVLEIHHEELEYLDYIDGEIEMRIEVSKENFLYEVGDIFLLPKNIVEKGNMYTYQDKYYFSLKEEASFYEIGILLENCRCIYHNKNPFIIKGKNLIHY